jgi:hypothetical protein
MSSDTYEVQEVFNEGTFPEVTYVEPNEYGHFLTAFRAEGKHLTLYGASGTGKTTLVEKVLRDEGVRPQDYLKFNGQKYAKVNDILQVFSEEIEVDEDLQGITDYLKLLDFIWIDDFHRLSEECRRHLSSLLKFWHENNVHFILVGIASSAQELFSEDREIGIRNEPFAMEPQNEEFVEELLDRGEEALNIKFNSRLRREIISVSNGIPPVVHIMAKSCCIESKVYETCTSRKELDVTLDATRQYVLKTFDAKYLSRVVGLSKGKKQSKSVHFTYFDIVKAISRSDKSEIPKSYLIEEIVDPIGDDKKRKQKRTSFYNCLNHLQDVIENKGLEDVIIYDEDAEVISIEDPTFRFYLNFVDLNEIERRIHRHEDEFPYDLAVSFAGEYRDTVESFVEECKLRNLNVYYDFDQQVDLWGMNLEETLADVFANQAKHMVVFLSEEYPKKDWPDFELQVGRKADDERSEEYILPVLIEDVEMVGINSKVAYQDLRQISVEDLAELTARKIAAD